MTMIFLIAGVVLAGMIVAGSLQIQSSSVRAAAVVGALVVLGVFVTLGSFQYIDEDSIGLVSKSFGWTSLGPGKIIATEGEKGPQADILPPGWHAWYWPFIYKIEKVPVIEIEQGTVGMLTAADGRPLPDGATYAPPWESGTKGDMLNAEHFLTDGKGFKGPQTTVLTPGKHRFNTKLFKLETAPLLSIKKAEVGVVKSNVGEAPPEVIQGEKWSRELVDKGQRGIWREPLHPDQYYDYSHSKAYEVTTISTKKHIVLYTAHQRSGNTGNAEEQEIVVRTSDGFTFPRRRADRVRDTPRRRPAAGGDRGR